MTFDYRYHRLDNGLRVLLHRDPSLPIVCVNMAYAVGSSDERKGLRGFAHLFEHLMFEGSANVPRGMFDRYCEQAGGYSNAYTNEDKTNYYLMLPSNHLATGLWLEADRLLSLQLTDEGFETQRSVVMEEKRQRVDNQPYGRYDTRMTELLFDSGPYGHPVIGYMEDLEAAGMEDVRAFHAAHYHPGNAVLCLAGDIDYDRALAECETYFADIPTVTIPAMQKPDAETGRGELRDVLVDAVPLPAVFMAWRIPAERKAAFVAMDLVSDLLGNGESSRLHRTLVYERQIASHVSAFVDPRQHSGLLLVYAIAAPGYTAEDVEAALEDVLQRLLTQGPGSEEFARTKNRVEATYYQSHQSLTSRADRFSHSALFYDDPEISAKLLTRYMKATPEAVHDAAREYMLPENRVVLHYLPADRNEEV